jgi:hypothetical protein
VNSFKFGLAHASRLIVADHREPPAKDVAMRAKLVIKEYFENDKLITEFLF